MANPASSPEAQRGYRGARLLLGVAALLIGAQLYRSVLNLSVFRAFALTVVSLFLEAFPFLLLGSAAAVMVRRFLPARWMATLAQRLGIYGVPLVALTGLVAPVCECAIVPTVRGLRDRGLPLPYAITVLVSVPVVNPIVIASTVAAFPGRGDLILARFLGGYAVAVLTGLVFSLVSGKEHSHSVSQDPPPGERHYTERKQRGGVVMILQGTLQEFLEVSRYFVVGALLSGLVQATVPPDRIAYLGTSILAATAVMISLAFVLSVCSEADAFIGKAFLPLLPAPSVIAFLVFGPMLDLKNTGMIRRVISRRQLALLAATLVVLVTGLAAGLHVLWGGFSI